MAGLLFRKGMAFGVVGCALIGSLVGCQGPTTVSLGEQAQGYQVSLSTDPLRLSPPQLSTLTFQVKDTKTGKIVTSFKPVSDALLHNILIHRDLQFFKHTFTKNTVQDQASILTYFPRTGTYVDYSIYQPISGTVQVFSTTITTGEPTGEVRVEEDPGPYPSRVSSGVRVQLVKPAQGYKVGQPSQIVVHVTERGRPVNGLWPLFGEAGHLWMVNENAEDFTHEIGHSSAQQLGPPNAEGAGSGPDAAATGVTSSQQGRMGTPSPPPTLAPDVAAALASVTAVPIPTLFPVQLTAQSSIMETPAVQPSVGFGPDVVFTHTFPREGLYKMWIEMQYRGQTFQTDFVVWATR